MPCVPGWETATVKYTQFEMRVEIVCCGRQRLGVGVKRSARTAASLQGIVNRLAADTAETVVLILSRESLG